MTDPVNFQAIGAKAKQMAADGVSPADIDGYVRLFGTDLETLNASGFGIKEAPATPIKAPPSGLRAAAIGASQGLMANFGDEIASGIAATVGRPGGEAIPGATWGERYQNALDIARPQQKEAQAAHPYIYGGAQLAGAVFPAIAAPELAGSSYIAGAPTLAQTAIRSGQIGGIYGGVTALGGAEGSPMQQAKETAIGAGTGAVVGAAVPVAVAGVQKGARWAWNGLKNMFMPVETVTEAASGGAGSAAGGASGASIDAVEQVRPRVSVDTSQNDHVKAINEIARALRRDGYSTDQITQVLNTMGPNGTLADLGQNTRQLLTASMSAPGPAKQIGATLLNNRQTLEQPSLIDAATKALGGGAGFHETDDALLARLEKEAGPIYEKAFGEAAPVDLQPVMDSIDQSLAKMPAKSPIRAAVERVRGMLGETIKETADDVKMTPGGNSEKFQTYTDLETLHNAKLAIDDMLSNFGGENSLGKVSKRQVTQIKNALLEAMDSANPVYKEARNKFSGIMTSKDALAAGRAFIKQDAEITADALAALAPEDQQFFREGAKRALADIIKGKPDDVSVVQQLRKTGLLEKVRELAPSQDAFDAFVQDLANIRRFAGTRAGATGGSQTVEKALGAADLAGGAIQAGRDAATGNTSGLLMSAFNKVKQLTGLGENARALIAQRLLSNDPEVINETLRAVEYAKRLQAITARTGAVGSIAGATGAGPAAGGLTRQP